MKKRKKRIYKSKAYMIGNTFRKTHGLTNSPEFYIWRSMKARCHNPKTSSYPRYGGRGIRVCDEWRKSFINFYKDMGPRPSKNHQIDRKNNNGNYTPENCHWVTTTDNSNNRCTNRFFTFNGETLTATQWAKKLGINRGAIQKRIAAKWDWDRIFTTPKVPRKFRVTINKHNRP